MALATLQLKKNEERRLRAGHLWIFSNEVDVGRTPLAAFQPGQQAVVQGADGKALGVAYVNPNSLICARLVSRKADRPLDRSTLVHRLNVALALRERLFPAPYYRVVHAEADALPGLVVDRFGEVVVIQLNTAGMEALKAEVIAAVEKVLKPQTILLRCDSSSRALEGLPSYIETVVGTLPQLGETEENGARFQFDLSGGQKTGWFFDHRINRNRMQGYVRGARVLDVFSYVGGWGIAAAVAGAKEVMCVDASERALDLLAANAERNGVGEQVAALEGDAFEALKALKSDEQQFDVVILDPPAFIKRRKDVTEGVQAYRRINQLAMQLLGKDGILISASCSHHLERDTFVTTLHQAARHLDRNFQILEQGHQGPDHPIHPAIPETDYLKCLFGRVVL